MEPTTPLQARTPFALELTYHRSISRDDFVRTSLDEMKRLSGPDPDASVPARWREHMQQAFVDVRPGERITGVYLPERGCRFYVNERLHHEVTDPQFAEAFFAIWFDPRSRDPGCDAVCWVSDEAIRPCRLRRARPAAGNGHAADLCAGTELLCCRPRPRSGLTGSVLFLARLLDTVQDPGSAG